MHEPEPQFEELPDLLVARLQRADRSQGIVDPRTDRVVIDDARRYFASRPRRARLAVMRWALPLAAAAALLIAVLVLRPFGLQRAADDVDGSGRVDILDAFALARSQADQESVDALAARIVSLGAQRSDL
jgi:hypothetical protein